MPSGPVLGPNPLRRGWKTFGQGTPKVVPVSASSTPLLTANNARCYAHIINNSATRIWIQYGIAAAVGRGIPLNPGAILSICGDELFLGAINAISQGPTVGVDIAEGVV